LLFFSVEAIATTITNANTTANTFAKKNSYCKRLQYSTASEMLGFLLLGICLEF